MSKRRILPAQEVSDRPATAPAENTGRAAYPSLREHLATRRRFLGLAGAASASVAAGGLFAACYRGLGSAPEPDAEAPRPDARTPSPDASTPGPDAHVEMPGESPWPSYFTLRIPVDGNLSAYLVDGGYCTFYVELVTYIEASYLALMEHLDAAGDRCRNAIADFTYDTLSTAAGVASAEDDVHDELDALASELTQTTGPTIEAVTVTISYLEPYAPIDGGMPEPSYP